jgi:hypothetical protein
MAKLTDAEPEKIPRSAREYGSRVLCWLSGAEIEWRNGSGKRSFEAELSWYRERRYGSSGSWKGGEAILLLASCRVCRVGGGYRSPSLTNGLGGVGVG